MLKEDRREMVKIRNENEDAIEVLENIRQRIENKHINYKAVSKIENEERQNRINTIRSLKTKMEIIKMSIDEILEIEKPYEERISMFS